MRTALVLFSTILLFACSETVIREAQSGGDLQVTVVAPRDGESGPQRYTTFSTIRLQISKLDGSIVRDTSISITSSAGSVLFRALSLEPHLVKAWTEDSEGDVIHLPQVLPVEIERGSDSQLLFELSPRCGSIIAVITNIPTSVDSLLFSFDSDSGFFEVRVPRSVTATLPLNKVPFGASGYLEMVFLRHSGDTMSSWRDSFTFSSSFETVNINMINSGSITMSIRAERPPMTLVTGSGDTTNSISVEVCRGVLISEFCATGTLNGQPAEFVEIINASDSTVIFSDLKLLVGSRAVDLPIFELSAGQRYVVTTIAGEEVWGGDHFADFDLVSTWGVLQIVDGSTLLDYLVYVNDPNAGWPRLASTAKRSWVLREIESDASWNNYGPRWVISDTPASEVGGFQWYGTPGR